MTCDLDRFESGSEAAFEKTNPDGSDLYCFQNNSVWKSRTLNSQGMVDNEESKGSFRRRSA
jgi:hypothetical protein